MAETAADLEQDLKCKKLSLFNSAPGWGNEYVIRFGLMNLRPLRNQLHFGPAQFSKVCITRPNLVSIMAASSFMAWMTSPSQQNLEPVFDKILNPLSADDLLPLMYFNFVQALTANIIFHGLDPRLMSSDIPSP